jgi:chromate transporter
MSLLLSLFIKLSIFSMAAFGGVTALLPTLFEISVNQEAWIDAQTFANYFAIAQAAPGPNLMTVTLIGWNAGGVLGAVLATVAVCWPSSIVIYWLQRFLLNMKNIQWQKTIEFAAAGLAVGLTLASAWQISIQLDLSMVNYLVSLMTIAIVLTTRLHPLYLIALGGILGMLNII